MQNRIVIYLSGSVVKDKEKETNTALWGDTEISTVTDLFKPLEVDFLNPSQRNDDLSDSDSIVGRDLMQVLFSDCIIVDCREKRGVGVGAEMLFAYECKKPVITIVPPNSHYHKDELNLLGQQISNWKHPFVEGLSDIIVHSLEEAVNYIKTHLTDKFQEVVEYPRTRTSNNINYYLLTQLARDTPMLELFETNPVLKSRKDNFLQGFTKHSPEYSLWQRRNMQPAPASATVPTQSFALQPR
jgi:hypothetical protein